MAIPLHREGRWALDTSKALLQAGLRLSAGLGHAEISDRDLAEATGVPLADFRSVFGDMEAYLHVLQELLARELEQNLRHSLGIEGCARERLRHAFQAYLDTCYARRGARAWLENLGRRSLPLRVSARKHQLRYARLLQSQLPVTGPEAEAEAQARLLAAALARTAREEARDPGTAQAGREALAGLLRWCTETRP